MDLTEGDAKVLTLAWPCSPPPGGPLRPPRGSLSGALSARRLAPQLSSPQLCQGSPDSLEGGRVGAALGLALGTMLRVLPSLSPPVHGVGCRHMRDSQEGVW